MNWEQIMEPFTFEDILGTFSDNDTYKSMFEDLNLNWKMECTFSCDVNRDSKGAWLR